jgi:polyhydroxyalkanoate synthesis regulator phasin
MAEKEKDTGRDIFEQGLHIGLGFVLRAKEQIEDWGKKISEQYEMNEEEGKRFVEDLVSQSDQTKTRLDEFIQNRLEQYFQEADVPSKEDIEKLNSKIESLEKKL